MTFLGGEGSDILFITGSNKCYGRYYIFLKKLRTVLNFVDLFNRIV